MVQCVISGTGLYTPPDAVSNEELVQAFNHYVRQFNTEHAAAIQAGQQSALLESSAEFIVKASGIKNRYLMDKTGVLDSKRMCPALTPRPDEALSLQAEMAVQAAEPALQQAKKTAQDIDAVLVACSNFQRPYPAIAVEVQAALGITGYAYDLNVACSSATFAIQAAVNSIVAGSARAVLVVNPEICSAHLNFRDRDSHFIFGDAATALIIERMDTCQTATAFAIRGTKLLTQFSSAIRNNSGFLDRTETVAAPVATKLFYQQGRKVYREVSPLVVELITQHLAEHQLSVADLHRLWLHQANLNMNLFIAEKLLKRAPTPQQLPIILDQYANTASAGSVIAFHLNHADLVPGAKGILCSFGAGYSIGNIILEKIALA